MPVVSTLEDVYAWLKRELNFFRVHLLFFLFVPLVSAAIFWGANGRFQISFVDALFLCYSALSVTGLSTVNLSTCTAFQQAILFFLMCIGNTTVVAWVMVLTRKRYFRSHLEMLQMKEHSKRKIADRLTKHLHLPRRGRSADARTRGRDPDSKPTNGKFYVEEGIGAALVGGGSAGIGMGIGLGMYQSSGNVNGNEREKEDSSEMVVKVQHPTPKPTLLQPILRSPQLVDSPPASIHSHGADEPTSRVLEEHQLTSESPQSADIPLPASPVYSTRFQDTRRPDADETTTRVLADQQFPSDSPKSVVLPLPTSPVYSPRSQATRRTQFTGTYPYSVTSGSVRRRGRPIPRRQLTVYQPSQLSKAEIESQLGFRAKDQGQGGFPGPIELSEELARRFHLSSLISWIGEQFKLQHNPRMQRLTKDFENLIIGRNSDFNTEELTDEELEELGGLEYRALRLLSYLVAFYFVGTQLFAFILIAPWLSTTHEYDDVFAAQPRLVNKSWFVAFQIVGSYTGGGMSLVDEGMVPFQRAYLMIFSMIFAILAGNHGLPIFLRLTIWIMTKFVRDDSTADKTLHFLLDHPRRCFLYLFPSHVTWFLVATLVIFTGFEWVAFIVLDIGLEVLKSLPPGIQALSGLFQSFAVRASGFPIVALSELAPSFQFLCIVMMYIAVYPVAMSIRSTNVYEEQSLGVFEAEPEDSDEEPALGESQGSRSERISKYFGWHLRRQVAYDIWWLVWGIFAVCIIERTKIMDDVNAPWFNVFRIVFELVSAFGGIGLTLGIPTQNYSFSGAFGPLSKLVVIVIMLRGRHRGLPVAVDRAILLPADMVLTSNPSTFDPRSPSRLPTTAPTSYVHTPEKGRSPTTSPGLDRRVYSREGPQPNMMDLVHDMNHIAAPQVIPETKDTNPNGDWQQSSEPKDYEV